MSNCRAPSGLTPEIPSLAVSRSVLSSGSDGLDGLGRIRSEILLNDILGNGVPDQTLNLWMGQ